MARAKSKEPWSYSCVRSSSHGLMRCHVCGKHITEGEYRYRATYNHYEHTGYVTAHRDCTTDDPEWAAKDKRMEEAWARRKALSIAAREFKAKWDVDELDDLIFEGDRND